MNKKDQDTLKETLGLKLPESPAVRGFYRPHARLSQTFTQPSKTKQAERDACDVNLIMARFAKTKMITHLNNAVAQWGVDVSNVPQYQDALEIVRQAESSFGQLSANVRDRFGNDPSKFMAFVHDPKNADELRAMGLRDPLSPAPAPIKVEITNEPPRGGEADKAPKKAS